MKVFIVFLALFFTINQSVEARRRFGRSFGKRATKSMFNTKRAKKPSRVNKPFNNSSSSRTRGTNTPFSRRGGFMNSMMGAVAGTMIGGFLFRSLGIGGHGNGAGGGGMGLFFPLLLIGGAYFLFRNRNKSMIPASASTNSQYQQDNFETQANEIPSTDELGLESDNNFIKERNTDFFSIQHAWSKKDLSNVSNKMTDEILMQFKMEFDQMDSKGHISTLENIMINDSQVTQSWSEDGSDYAKMIFSVSLIEYESDKEGNVISGLKGIPTDLDEAWLFTKAPGQNDWKLCGIDNQMNS